MTARRQLTPEDLQHRDGEAAFLDQLRNDVQHNRLVLPSLPDVARKVREAVEDPHARVEHVARVIGTDAAMSARLLKVANSPLYRRAGSPIDDVRTAVTRLGLSLVRTLIINLSIVQVLRPHRGGMGESLHRIFQHSVTVATWSYALAERYTNISPHEAMLAGMVHDIGYLPILQYAAHGKLAAHDPERLRSLLHRHHAEVGTVVLDTWNFGDGLKDVVRQHENVYRTGRGPASLVDLVIAAELHAGHEDEPARRHIDRSRIPALLKLGLDETAVGEDPQVRRLVAHAARLLRL